jgi:hypothetical protein
MNHRTLAVIVPARVRIADVMNLATVLRPRIMARAILAGEMSAVVAILFRAGRSGYRCWRSAETLSGAN